MKLVIAIIKPFKLDEVRDALVAVSVDRAGPRDAWSLPVVGETYDGLLNDINGFHVRAEHLRTALDAAGGGPVQEGNVGGGSECRVQVLRTNVEAVDVVEQAIERLTDHRE